MPRILVIDDDEEFGSGLAEALHGQGHEARWIGLAEEGLRTLSSGEAFDLVLLDNKMPAMSGLEFLAAARARNSAVPVVLMTSAHNDRTVIEAMNLGAFAYVLKPMAAGELLRELGPIVREALEVTGRPPPVKIRLPGEPLGEDDSVIVGRSRPMLDVLMRIGRIARVDETVLILGETGTGKDLVARALHTHGPRRERPFVVMNCTALNENLLDDELFGHEAHAFTGADKLRKGRFEHANGGTLFLDEVGDMPLSLQAKLLRVLENREVVRVGSNDPIRVDVRVVAATHRDPRTLVAEGKFRQDLFFRLDGLTIRLPPLRERKEDIELLAHRFLARMFGGATSAPTLSKAALERLREHPWPGNIRQLQKVLGRAAGICRGTQITPDDLDFGSLESDASRSGDAPPVAAGGADAVRQAAAWAWRNETEDVWPRLQETLERELLRCALAEPGLSQVQVARRLGIARNTLRARLKQLGLEESSNPDDVR